MKDKKNVLKIRIMHERERYFEEKKRLNEIELVDSIKGMEEDYRKAVRSYIKAGLITLEEWNSKYKFYRDLAGYSMIHYLQCAMMNREEPISFITLNPILLEHRKELIERFHVQIMTLEEAYEFTEEQ